MVPQQHIAPVCLRVGVAESPGILSASFASCPTGNDIGSTGNVANAVRQYGREYATNIAAYHGPPGYTNPDFGQHYQLNDGSSDNPCTSAASGNLGGDVINAACTLFYVLGQVRVGIRTATGAYTLIYAFAATLPPSGGGDSQVDDLTAHARRTVLQFGFTGRCHDLVSSSGGFVRLHS